MILKTKSGAWIPCAKWRASAKASIWRCDIPIHRTYFHEIAQPQAIKAGLRGVLAELNAEPDVDLHPLEAAAAIHHRFMHVFPFSQASGTIGRLLLNFTLLRGGLSPVVVHASDRQQPRPATGSATTKHCAGSSGHGSGAGIGSTGTVPALAFALSPSSPLCLPPPFSRVVDLAIVHLVVVVVVVSTVAGFAIVVVDFVAVVEVVAVSIASA
ncbi:hypothetical protein NBRC10513_006512 [Rhodotorula toruloides]